MAKRKSVFLRKTVIAPLLLVVLVALAGFSYLAWIWHQPLQTLDKIYEVNPGSGLHHLARELETDGVIADRRSLIWLAYLTGNSRELKVGEYRFADGITQRQLLRQVTEGRVAQHSVVLLEGWTFRQMRQALEQAPKLKQSLLGLSDATVMARLGYPDEHPEGRFFPDTYFYTSQTTDLMILRQAYQALAQRLQKEWETREPDLPLATPYEALILASIIEKETGQAYERPLIAGVFINRLRIPMRLQTDPTVIYGMGLRFDGDIRTRDLRRDTPYNTYTRDGLPPTPIAMPSGAAIHAALHPATTKALYFVGRGDGSHVFSETLEQHNAAVRKYQLGQ